MDINPSKCFSLNVSRKRKPLIMEYILTGATLETTDSSIYLGITIQNDFKWGEHINTITTKVNRTVGLLSRNVKKENRELKCKAFNTHVHPVLDYDCSVWHPHLQQDIDKVQGIQRIEA